MFAIYYSSLFLTSAVATEKPSQCLFYHANSHPGTQTSVDLVNCFNKSNTILCI